MLGQLREYLYWSYRLGIMLIDIILFYKFSFVTHIIKWFWLIIVRHYPAAFIKSQCEKRYKYFRRSPYILDYFIVKDQVV